MPSTISSQRSLTRTSKVTPTTMPISKKGSKRSNSPRSRYLRFFRPSNKPAKRSNTSIIGTAKRKGKKCASSGMAMIAAPNPVRPYTVYATVTISAALSSVSQGSSITRSRPCVGRRAP